MICGKPFNYLIHFKILEKWGDMASQEPKQRNRLMGDLHREAPYEGLSGQTHAELLHYSCACGAIFPLNVLRSVNVSTDRELAEAAVAGTLNHSQCPSCSRQIHVDIPYVLHHPSEERFVLVIPENQRHRELEIRGEFLKGLNEATTTAIPRYVMEYQVVFGTEGLRDSLSRPPGHVLVREELMNLKAEVEERERQTAEVERIQTMREAQLDEKERAVEQQEESVMMREERLKERGENVTRLEDELRQREASHQAHIEALEVRVQMIEQRDAELAKREQQLNAQAQSLQEWEGQLRSQQHTSSAPNSDLISSAPKTTIASTPPAGGFESQAGATAPEQDIITSLMRDPEHDELTTEPTQRSRSMTAALANQMVVDDDEAEELTDDDLIEEAEELSADDLIEGETDLHAIPQEPQREVPSTPPATPAPTHAEASSGSILPGLDKAPPVAPPPAGMSQRPLSPSKTPSAPPSTAAPTESAEPVAQSPSVEPEPVSEPEPAEPAKPFLEPPPLWVRSGARTMHEIVGDDIYLLAKVDNKTAKKAKDEAADLWVQLHLLPTYPLITLTLVFEPEADELEGIHWFLDIQKDSDRQMLQQLRRRFRVNVLFFNEDYELFDEAVFESPREVNVARVVDRATQELGEIGDSTIDDKAAHSKFDEDWSWAGKKKHPFTEDAYAEINSVGEAKIALGILNYWSEPKNREYLVLTKSVPIDLLDTITRRILDGAIKFGLWLPQSLKERAVALALATELPALVAKLIDAFAALGSEPEGLEATDIAENWQRLLRDADELDVPVNKETAKLAESVIEGVIANEEQEEEDAEPLDLSKLSEMTDDELLALLDRRTARKAATLELASRGNDEHLEALFRAARKMSRLDLVPVIPALLEFGESSGDYFVEGLTARKSFTRQACAIALGELKLRRAVVPLLHQLMAEKTPVWHEIARALGRYGPTGIKPLHRYLRDPKGKEDRLVRAMAFFAVNGAAKQIEEIASGRDTTKSALGSRALDMRDAVRTVEEQVRGNEKIEEQAPVLRFSRRLQLAIAGEEQGEDDELLEELGDSDIMELEEGEE